MFLLLLLAVEVQNTICNSFNNYIYHKLMKFEQTRNIQSSQNLQLSDKMPFTIDIIFDISLALFWKK